MLDDHFIKQGDLAQELVQSGVVGRIAGFNVFESNNMDFESTTRVASKKPPPSSLPGTRTGATVSWSGRSACICRT